MRIFLLALSLLLLVACGGDEGAGFTASISSPQPGSSLTEKQITSFEGVVSDGINPLGAIETSWWSGQRLLCKWKKLEEGGLSLCEAKLRVGEDELTLMARDPGLAGLPDRVVSDTVTVLVLPEAQAPKCKIQDPSGDWGMQSGESLAVKAKVTAKDQDLSGQSVQWSSDQDGDLGQSTIGAGGSVDFQVSGLSEGRHLVTMVFDVAELGSCSAEVKLGVGPAPVVSITSPSAPVEILEGETFAAVATVEHTESVSLTWRSSLDGDLKTRTIRAGGESKLSLKTLSAGQHLIEAVAMDSLGIPGLDGITVTVEGIPTAPVIEIGPDPAFTEDEIALHILKDSSDPEGAGNLQYVTEWYRDGTLVLKDTKLVGADLTDVGEVWEVRVWAVADDRAGHVASASLQIGGFFGWGSQTNAFSVSDSIVRGEQQDDRLGTGLAAGCDLDGDGLDELLVGAPYNDEGGSSAGRTYVIRGSQLSSDSQVDTYFITESLIGEGPADYSGSSLDCGGDVDGDGVPDILVASPGYEHSTGQSYLVLGKSFKGDMDLMSADHMLIGENVGDLSGSRVSFGGDVDGDGRDDVLVGAWANDDQGTFSGKAYWISSSSFSAGGSMNLGDADMSWVGAEAGHRNGHAVNVVGDVDGDGLDDIGMGAYGYDSGGSDSYMGAVYVVLSSSVQSGVNSTVDKADHALFGEGAKHYAGYDIAPHGDVDGDGLDDFLVSAIGYTSASGGGGGAVYLVLASDLQSGTQSLASVSYVFEGETPGDNVGRSIASAGDVDRDGLLDILIGAPSVDDLEVDGGQAYLLLGAELGAPGATHLGQASYIFSAVDEHEVAGREVVSGDFNGDGMMDLAVGAPDAGSNTPRRGHSYVLFAK